MGSRTVSPARLENLEPRLLLSTTWTPSPEAFGEAQAICAWNGSAQSFGLIQDADDVDVKRFEAAEDGLATVNLETTVWGDLLAEVEAYTADGTLLAEGEADADGNATISFRVDAGQTYYLTLGGQDDTQGWYRFSLMNVPEPFASATVIDLDPLDTEARTGTLEAGESAAYAFTAQSSGEMYLDVAAGQDGLDPTLELYRDPHWRWLANDNATADTLDSSLFVRSVQQGQTYYVVVGGADETAGDYTFTVAISPRDDAGNDIAHAAALRGWGWSVYDYGTIDYAGDVDMKAYEATESGRLTITQRPSGWGGGSLTCQVAAYDADGELLAQGETDADGAATVSVRIEAGQTYYLAFGGADGTTGRYQVSGATLVEPFASATVIDLDPLDTEARTGTLGAGESVAYAFTAQATGQMYLDVAAGQDGLDPTLELYRDPRWRMASNDNASADTLDSSLFVRSVQQGQTYYVVVGGADETAGDYTFTVAISPRDDAGNDIAHAAALRGWGWSVYDYGTIDYAGDVDMKAYEATESGRLTITQRPSGWGGNLTCQVAAYNADGELLAQGETDADGAATVSVRIEAGQTYYLAFGGADDSTGRYQVSGATLVEPFASATVIDLDPLDTEMRMGALAAGESVAYVFTTSASGSLTIAAEGDQDGLDPTLELYRDPRWRMASNDNASADTLDSQISVRSVRQGQTYYVVVAGAEDTAGDYTLTLTSEASDDCGNTLVDAATLRLNGYNGRGTATGRVDYSGDVDVFELTATDSGALTVTQSPSWWGTPLAGELWLYDATGAEVGHATAAGGTTSVTANVIDGFTYYVKVGDRDGGTGRYSLGASLDTTVTPDPGDDPFAGAEVFDLPTIGQVDLAGQIDAAGEVDIFRFTAEVNGAVAVEMDDAGGLDAYLRLYNSDRELVDANDAATRGATDAQFDVDVVAGQTYYIVASGAQHTTGSYDLAVVCDPDDDYGNTLADARLVYLDGSGNSRLLYGDIDYAGDVDMATFVATVTGAMTIDQAPWPQEGAYTATIVLYDADGVCVACAAPGAAAGLTAEVVAGERYYLESGAEDDGAGRYRLQMTTEAVPDPTPDPDPDPDPEPDPDPDPDPDPAPDPDIDYTPGLTVVTQVVGTGAAQTLVVLGTDGTDPITLSETAGGYTIKTLWGTTTFSGSYAGIEVYGFGGGDTITLEHALTLDATIYGGSGDDRLFDAGTGQTIVYGQAGDDLIVTVGGGADTVLGGSGVDSLWFDGADSLRDADAAEYAATSIHQVNQFYQPTSNPSEHVSLEIAGQDIVDPTASGTFYGHSYRPLWVDGPEYNDIRQGSLGDCYFMASLASLADTDPNALREMIAPMGDGTYAIRYYRNGTPTYLRVDTDLPGSPVSPKYARITPDGELWVALAEKAYAQFRYGQNSYASLSGGWMDPVYQAVTGQWTTRLSPTSSSTATAMANYLDAGHGVTAASKSNSSTPIVGLHAYMVKDVEVVGEQTYVTVYNPWSVDGRIYDNNYGDGLLRLTWSTFTQNFSTVVVSMA